MPALILAAAGWSAPGPPAAAQDSLAALIAAAGRAEDYLDADIVVIFDRTEVDVEDSGLSHVINHTLTKILTEDGARDQAAVRFDYDPATQAVEIQHVSVHRAGGTIEPVDLTQLVDVTAPASMIYWGGRMQVVALPRLRVGDAVEIDTYRKGFQIAYLEEAPPADRAPDGSGTDGAAATTSGDDSKYIPPMRGHFYDVVLFAGSAPIKEKTYTLRSLKSKPVQYQVYNGEVACSATFDDTHDTYKFWKTDIPRAPHEWRSPGLSDYATKVVLATVQNWQEKSRWFFETNDWVFADNPDIQAKVKEITEGLTDRAEIVSAINHWVAQEIRYCGLSMGKGEGYTIHPGQMIFNERSGVCKDIAGMTITMLRSAGFDVYPAMTMAGARVERIPADQFNHCVAALRLPDGSFQMLDPTWVPFAMADWSRAEGEQNYVIGTPEGEDLTETPAYTPDDNLVELSIEGRLQDNGDFTGKLSITGRGYSDTRLRRSFGFTPEPQWTPHLAAWLAALAPSSQVTDIKLGDYRDLSAPFSLKLSFTIPGFALAGRQTLVFQPCGAQLIIANYGGVFRFMGQDQPQERETPALIWYPQAIRITEEYKLPRGFEIVPAEDSWRAGTDEDVAACDLTCRQSQSNLAITGSITIRGRTIEPDQWPAFKKVLDRVQEIAQCHLVAERKGT